MAKSKSSLGVGLGFITFVITRVMATLKQAGAEDAVTLLSEDKLRELTDQFAQSLVAAGRAMVKSTTNLLQLVTTVQVEAVECFVAADHFVRDTSPGAAVKIAYLGDNFRQHFLPKIEDNLPATELAIHRLLQNSLDDPIRQALGSKRAETRLAQLYSLLQLQGQGQAGLLLTNGCANIFYVRDTDDQLWAVSASWASALEGWHVVASSVSDPGSWSHGRQVVSCK